MHEKTLGHIKEWYKRFFNHAGWTLLAAAKGHTDKRLMFTSEAEKLAKSIREKYDKVSSPDLKRDLGIMAKNVDSIKTIISSHNLSMTEMSNYKEVTGNVQQLTFHSLERMYKGTFQKVGWALLGAGHGHASKLNCLMDTFSYLHYCLEEALDSFKDKDKKHELEIMDDHVRVMLSINYTKSRSSSPQKQSRRATASASSSASGSGRRSPRGEVEGSVAPQGAILSSPEMSRRSAPTSMSSSTSTELAVIASPNPVSSVPRSSRVPGSPSRTSGSGSLSSSINPPLRMASPRGSRSRTAVSSS